MKIDWKRKKWDDDEVTRDLWTGVKSVPQQFVTSLQCLELALSCLRGTDDALGSVPYSSNTDPAEMIILVYQYLNGNCFQTDSYAVFEAQYAGGAQTYEHSASFSPNLTSHQTSCVQVTT